MRSHVSIYCVFSLIFGFRFLCCALLSVSAFFFFPRHANFFFFSNFKLIFNVQNHKKKNSTATWWEGKKLSTQHFMSLRKLRLKLQVDELLRWFYAISLTTFCQSKTFDFNWICQFFFSFCWRKTTNNWFGRSNQWLCGEVMQFFFVSKLSQQVLIKFSFSIFAE